MFYDHFSARSLLAKLGRDKTVENKARDQAQRSRQAKGKYVSSEDEIPACEKVCRINLLFTQSK